MPNSVAAVRSGVVTANFPALLLLLVAFAYIAFGVLPGPRRVPTGGELPILIGVGALLVVISLCRPKRVPYLAGVLAVGIAFASAPSAPLPGPPGGWLVALMFPMGWTLLGSALRSWRAGAASYIAAGLWTVVLLAVPEGVMYFDGPLHDADQLFWEVLAPIAFWPWVTFGMLGVFGVLFV
jgi:hypothetical protein